MIAISKIRLFGIAAAILVAALFVCICALFYFSLADEEYRRFASWHLPPGHVHRGVWQNFHGYPLDSRALWQVVLQMWLPMVVLSISVLYLAQFAMLAIRACRRHLTIGRPRLHFVYYVVGVLLGGCCVLMALGLRNEWFGDWPIRQTGYLAAAFFAALPFLSRNA